MPVNGAEIGQAAGLDRRQEPLGLGMKRRNQALPTAPQQLKKSVFIGGALRAVGGHNEQDIDFAPTSASLRALQGVDHLAQRGAYIPVWHSVGFKLHRTLCLRHGTIGSMAPRLFTLHPLMSPATASLNGGASSPVGDRPDQGLPSRYGRRGP